MSFYKSLNQAKLKIQQKNIVLLSGNVQDFIFESIEGFPIDKKKKRIYTLVEYITEMLKQDSYKFVSLYSPTRGSVTLLDNDQVSKIEQSTTNKKGKFDDYFNNDEEGDKDSINVDNSEVKDDKNKNESGKISLQQYVAEITRLIKSQKKISNNDKSNAFIIDFSEVNFEKSIGASEQKFIAELLNNFINQDSNSILSYIERRDKLILISRNPNLLTNLIPTNNSEFGSVSILKPDNKERSSFFKKYSNCFDIGGDFADDKSADKKDAIRLTDNLSFREISQLAKINNNHNETLNFKQLYGLATFNKTESEWEKIDFEQIKKLKTELRLKVKGQDEAIAKVQSVITKSFVGLSGISHSLTKNKPKGALFFVGPTGTGKTELAKAIASFVFGDESKFIRFDMSEYNHEHSDQRLIGAPPGYVGYDAGGQLTTAIKERPFSVLLFDEIEKAHPKILDKFLQILEDGRLTSSQGETIDFSETFIIFTSNIGSDTVGSNQKETGEHFVNAVSNYFTNEIKRPELLNRIGLKNIVSFNFITDDKIIKSIINAKIKMINQYLKEEKSYNMLIDESAAQCLIKLIINNYDKKFGGRGIVSSIDEIYIDALSDFIAQNHETIKAIVKDKRLASIKLSAENNKIKFALIS